MQIGTGVVKSIQSEHKSMIDRDMQRRYAQSWKERIPNRYARYTLQSHPDARGRKAAGQWIAGEEWNAEIGRNLVIAGPVGTGKTSLAIGILRHVHHLGVGVMYVNMPDLLTTMAGAKWDQKASLMADYQEVPLLLLDDLGADHVKDWTVGLLYEVIEGRYRTGAPTIVTSNLSQTEMRKVVGDRIVSRLFEGAIRIELTGEDLRKNVVHSVYK